MSGKKIVLFLVIMLSGGGIETAWRLRNLGVNPEGCFFLPGRLRGPATTLPSEQRVAVPDGTVVVVDNAFGPVTLKEGDPKSVHVELQSVVYLSPEQKAREVASKVAIEARLEGRVLKVGTNRQALESQGELRDAGLETHLLITLPPKTPVEVHSDHGTVTLSDVAGAKLDTSFSDIHLTNVDGPLSLVSRHGDVSASGVTGALDVESHFGDVNLQTVSGAATLKVDHGDLNLDHAGPSKVDLKYGDFKGGDIRGTFEFVGEHAGVAVSEVKTSCTITTNYRDVEAKEIGGDLKVKADHGSLDASTVAGLVDAEVSYDDVHLSSVKGTATVSVVHGGFHGEGLDKGAHLNVSGDDVELSTFQGPVAIETTRGSVNLKPSKPLVDPVTVTTTNGGIVLAVPRGSRFDLEASVNVGDLSVASLPGLVASSQSSTRVQGKVAGGGNAVKLQAKEGDVSVESNEEP
jgi:DUF4097 and DUF4098 domain-containing protein YvlB